DRIDAELATDDTATGRRQAAVARAAQPTIQAKEQAWADIIERTDLPNALIEAAMAGFPQPNQREVLSAFRERYFADLPGTWSERTMEMAQEITVGLYPFLLADDETVRLTDAYLDGERQAAERRLVIEGRDGVQRAIRAQAADR
ncbi:MAG: ERAP1-like C-terminal domain-containing protein, partial [Actinomycetales bacterium]